MSYAKLFSSITESSLWSEPKEVRILFVSMLAKADPTGFVEAAVPGLARLSNLSTDEVTRALEVLSSPDPHSKDLDVNPANQGRRVVKVPGGWMILNYENYRDRRDDEARRIYMRSYMRQYRKDLGGGKQSVNDVNSGKPPLAQAEAEAEAEADQVHTHTVLPKHIGLVEASPEGARAIEKSKERMISLPPLPDKRVVKDKSEVKQAVKSCLCVMYKRPEDEPWQYAEECLLIEILKRPDPLRDITMLREFRSRMKSKRYFPQSIGRLLQDWATTLDRARVAEKNPSLCSD